MIYLDNASTTPLDADVLEAMLPYLKENFANPSSQHAAGRRAADGVVWGGDNKARVLVCNPGEVYLVCGGTEAGNRGV